MHGRSVYGSSNADIEFLSNVDAHGRFGERRPNLADHGLDGLAWTHVVQYLGVVVHDVHDTLIRGFRKCKSRRSTFQWIRKEKKDRMKYRRGERNERYTHTPKENDTARGRSNQMWENSNMTNTSCRRNSKYYKVIRHRGGTILLKSPPLGLLQ